MYYNFLVPVPTDAKIVRQTKKGTTYVDFEYDRTYDKKAGYTIPKRSTIGKISLEDSSKMWPNQNYIKYFPDVELPESLDSSKRSSLLRVGGYMVIKKVLEETKIPELLERFYTDGDKKLILDLVSYSLLTENNAGQYFPDYEYNHPLFAKDMTIYSDTKVSDFLQGMTDDQRIAFLNEWNAIKDHRERIYISYDATNKNCQAGDVDFAEYGYAKDDPSKKIINYSVAYDTQNREPLFYEEYPGSINDVSQLRYTVDKAMGYGYRHIGFILDRGYFNKKNFEYMDECGYGFIILVKGCKELVRKLIKDSKGSFEKKRSCYIQDEGVAGITIKRKMFESDEKERYFHLFYSLERELKERNDFEEEIKSMSDQMKKFEGKACTFPEKYEEYFKLFYQEIKEKVVVVDENNKATEEEKEILKEKVFLFAKENEKVIEEKINLMGYFAIVTSDEMTAEQALKLYNSRDVSEKLFRSDKSFLDNHSFRVSSNESVKSKVFVAFIALIVRNRIFSALQDEIKRIGKKPNFMTVPAALRELEKIEMVRLTDNSYYQDHAITKTQKTILNAFKMDSQSIKYQAELIRKELERIQKKYMKEDKNNEN